MKFKKKIIFNLGFEIIAKLLIDKNATLDYKDKSEGSTPIFYAVNGGRYLKCNTKTINQIQQFCAWISNENNFGFFFRFRKYHQGIDWKGRCFELQK